jgi:glycosyltransferase involved in cell wall biosynthesis
MGKKNKNYPLVSVCTPTFNRRPFISTMFECFRNQNYPKSKIEWIIVDDGTDKIKDLIDNANIPQIKYFEIDTKMTLGAKRNFMHKQATGSYIVYMDDDDYYPPDRISHAIETLKNNPTAMCAGSSELYVYFKHIKKMYQCGPYGPTHATAGTFAFRKELLHTTKYNENASLAEEREFLKDYTIPFVQLDPLKTILVFSHIHNTYDKRKMLENPNPEVMKVSNKTVDTFIKHESEKNIKDFFLKNIDQLLQQYKPGDPKMKPDVIKQLNELETERKKMMEQMQKQMQIMVQEPGKEPRLLTINEAMNIIAQQSQQLQQLQQQVQSTNRIGSNNSSLYTNSTIELQSRILELEQKIKQNNVNENALRIQLTSSLNKNNELQQQLDMISKKTEIIIQECENKSLPLTQIENKKFIIKNKSLPEVNVKI